jgi:uncharacterized protein (TIGR02300 family)
MTKKEARGTKRTCQNSECGSRFYDLNRDPIICPVCRSAYVIASAALTGVPVEDLKPKKTPEFKDSQEPAEEAVESEEAVALADIEGGEEPVAAEEDETFLEEEEEDGGDVSGIIGGNVDEGEEEP